MKNVDVGILITGNEILSFKTRDTNGPFMGMHLRKLGLGVKAAMMCGDSQSDILDCLNYLSARCQIILMTGGLGPTSDDITSEVVAQYFNLQNVFYEEAWENCLVAYKKFSRTHIPESNKKQALLPEGCELLPNKVGTAVGFKVTGVKNEKTVSIYCMPGVPYEMEPMFLESVLPRLKENSMLPVSKTWQIFLLGESAMQSSIEDAEKMLKSKYPNHAISYQAHSGFVTYSVSLFPINIEEQKKYSQFLENEYTQEVQKSFHQHILYSGESSLNQYLLDIFIKKNKSLSFIEGSCGGILSKQISSLNYSEKIFHGSRILKSSEQFFEFDNIESDVTVLEWGSPSEAQSCDAYPHGNFNIIFAFKKDSFVDEDKLTQKLLNFSWHQLNTPQNQSLLKYSLNLNISTRYSKEVQQMRVAYHCLCSLALIAEFL